MASMALPQLQVTLLGERAQGTLGPNRVLVESTWDFLRTPDVFQRALQRFLGGCSDKRLDKNGLRLALPPVFGGFASAVLADAMTQQQVWYQEGDTFTDHAMRMAKAIPNIEEGILLCIHTDTLAAGKEECGCAAIKLSATLCSMLATDFADLIDPDYREGIVDNIRMLLESGYFGFNAAHEPDFALRSADFVQKLGLLANVQVETLTGALDGVAFVYNDREGEVLDRPMLNRQGYPHIFECAVWSVRYTAKRLAATGQAEAELFAAMDAWNRLVPYAIGNKNAALLTVK